MSWLTTLPPASMETPGISLVPRARGPMPERKSRLPTRLTCGNAPTGSGARELSKDSLMAPTLAARDRAHDEEWFCTLRHRLGQNSIGWLVGNIFFAREEANHRPALLRDVIANRSPQCRIICFQRVEHRALRDRAIDLQLHFVANFRQRAQVMRQDYADHASVCTSTDKTAGRSRTIGFQESPESGEQ